MPASPYRHEPQDFAERQARNRAMSAGLIFSFILIFLLLGFSVDYLYLDAWSSAGRWFPVATVASLALATVIALASYYGGSELILRSLGAEELNIKLPEHRELQNVVTEMALASGCPMPRVYVI
ncbi:MAG: hypothetical protein HY695_28785, partial [Deltaproteobacteria bacterium]|nr:hypothetical protein [Deltaproteobacteria bacterium]